MNFVFTFLIVSNVAVAAWYAVRKCWSPRGIEFNHVLSFTCGFLFYWILPIALGIWRIFDDVPAMSVWYKIFDEIDDSKLVTYLFVSLVAYLSFVFGTERGERSSPKSSEPSKKHFLYIRLMNGYLLLAGVFLLAAGVKIRGEFFKGYSNIGSVEDLYGRSVFGAVMVFSISLWILYTSMRHQKLEQSGVTFSVFANRFLALYAVEAALAISMGSRYIVLSSAFMVVTYCSVYVKKWRPLATGTFGAILLAFALIVGALRTGLSATQAIGDIVFSGLEETLNGALSLTYFLREYSFGVLRWPVFLLSDYIYLVPRVLLPMKDSMILSPEDRGFHIENPVGGVNSFFSFMVNFGALGTVVFLFLFAFGMGFLKSRRGSVLARTTYSMISGWLLISFFRNPFEVSLVKDIFQMSIVVPASVLGSVYFLSSSLRRRRPLPAEGGSQPESRTQRPTSAHLSERGAGAT
jgi:hypothetical protein